MNFLTEKDIESINDEYFKNRYSYFKEVIDEIKLMEDINTILELGPYKSPLTEGEDVIDITDAYVKDYPIKIGKFIKHDCSITPYPFKDKEYDLVIACQVLEHLGKNQIEVFKELSRISKKAIITLPYKWNNPCDVHHMIDEKIIDHWTQGLKPVYEKYIGIRILQIYNFDKTSIKSNKMLQKHADFQILKMLEDEHYNNKILITKLEDEQKRIKMLENLMENKDKSLKKLDYNNKILITKLEDERKRIKMLENLIENKNKILERFFFKF